MSIKLSETQSHLSENSKLILTGFSTNYEDISFDALANKSWIRIENELHADLKNFSAATWKGFVSDSTLTFETGPYGPEISILWNGEETIVDTFSETPGSIKISQEHPPLLIEKILTTLSYILCMAWIILVFFTLNQLTWKNTSPSREDQQKTKQIPQGFFFSLILGISAFILFLVFSSPFETLITSDSSSYLHCGKQLAAGNGYISGDGDFYVWWGPLYPAIIALLNFLPPDDIFLKVRLLNALLYSAAIFLSGMVYHDLLKPKNLLEKSGLLLILAAGWFLISFNYVLSEPLFIFLSLLFFYAFNKYLDTKRQFWVTVFTLASIGHILTRYNGVSLAISACLIILLFFKEPFIKRLLKTFSFGICSTAPLFLWLGHNYFLKQTLTGIRPKSELSLSDNFSLASNVISGWFFPFTWNFLSVFIIVLFSSILLFLLYRKKSEKNFENEIKFSMITVFVISFISQMVISLSIIKNTPLNDRLLSPVYIPMIIGASWVSQQLFIYLNKKLPRFPYKLVGVILICLFLYQPLRSYAGFEAIKSQNFTDCFFTSEAFKQSKTIQYLNQVELDPDQIWFSNCSRCTLVFSEKLTRIFEPYSSYKFGYLPDGNQAFYLVWFDDFYAEGINQKLDPVSEIENLNNSPLQIQIISDFSDGQIYYVCPEADNPIEQN